MLVMCGAGAPMCWLYVVLRVHLCVGYMWSLECTYVLVYVVLRVHLCVGICGAWSANMCWLCVVRAHLCAGYMCCGVLGVHLVQEGSGPCKIPNFSISYGVMGHICTL